MTYGTLPSAGSAILLAALVGLSALPAPAAGADSAVVFMYHRFGEDKIPSTNIRIGQFEEHIKELTGGKYTVLPLPEIVDAFRGGRPLPDRTIALTADDAYRSIYTEAWPRLKKAGLPFTLFVATEPIDAKVAGMMTWDQIRELAANGVTIGGHGVSHSHMPLQDEATQRQEIARSNDRFQAELGRVPTLFAYPFGEADRRSIDLAEASGAVAAFGQHSGVAHAGGERYYLPRFTLNETHGEMPRFRLAANALPLPVRDFVPMDPAVRAGNPPTIGFTVADDIRNADRIGCYGADGKPLPMSRSDGGRIEIKPTAALPTGRWRLNCTVPAGDGRTRWFGRQLYVPPK